MALSTQAIPATRVISPSPTPSEHSARESFSSKHKASQMHAPETLGADGDPADPDYARARSRSRSPAPNNNGGRRLGSVAAMAMSQKTDTAGEAKTIRHRVDTAQATAIYEDKDAGLLKPTATAMMNGGFGSRYWRELSRSPSPLGLIPIHREWRKFIHKHEIPRKALHVSIGFLTLWLYSVGKQLSDIHPVLMSLLIPVFLMDVVRFSFEPVNRVYIRALGPFMREAEAHDRYNGVISYLGGVCAVMFFCPKDVAVISVLLLSFCDAAASTFGRLWGKYTPRIRKGKSLAGSVAALVFGIASALLFYVLVAPRVPSEWNQGPNEFAFDGHLALPHQVRHLLGLSTRQASIQGYKAVAVVSIVSGLVASMSEAVDLFGLDDNLTIPILCGLGLGAFLKTFR